MIKGSIVAIITPFKDNKIDFNALEKLISWHLESGTKAITVAGTTGESPVLSSDEYTDLISFVLNKVAGKISVIAGTGSNSTSASIEKTVLAKKLGADAALVVVPYYNKPTQEGLYLHFKTIHDNSDIPIILYNVPGRTITDLADDTVARLAELKRVVGIKDATADISRLTNLRNLISREDFCYLSGDDATTYEYIKHGGDGAISVTANVYPKEVAMLCDYALAQEYTKAEEINSSLVKINKDLFVEPNPIPVKWLLYKLGKISNEIRLPLTCLSTKHHNLFGEFDA